MVEVGIEKYQSMRLETIFSGDYSKIQFRVIVRLWWSSVKEAVGVEQVNIHFSRPGLLHDTTGTFCPPFEVRPDDPCGSRERSGLIEFELPAKPDLVDSLDSKGAALLEEEGMELRVSSTVAGPVHDLS
jgi:hypothetical protein